MNSRKGIISKANGNKLDRINRMDRILFAFPEEGEKFPLKNEAVNVANLYYTKVRQHTRRCSAAM